MNLVKKLKTKVNDKKKGFTLIELIVVIAIIGILAGVLLPKLTGFTNDARESAVRSEAKNISTAITAIISKGQDGGGNSLVGKTDALQQAEVEKLVGDISGTLKITDTATGTFTYDKNGSRATYKADGTIEVKKTP